MHFSRISFFCISIALTAPLFANKKSKDCNVAEYHIEKDERWRLLSELSAGHQTLQKKTGRVSFWKNLGDRQRFKIYDEVFHQGEALRNFIESGNSAAAIDVAAPFMATMQHTVYQVRTLRQLAKENKFKDQELMKKLAEYETQLGENEPQYFRFLKVLESIEPSNRTLALIREKIEDFINELLPKGKKAPEGLLLPPTAESLKELVRERIEGYDSAVQDGLRNALARQERIETSFAILLSGVSEAGGTLAAALAQYMPTRVPVINKLTSILNDFVTHRVHGRTLTEKFFNVELTSKNIQQIMNLLEQLHGTHGYPALVSFFRMKKAAGVRAAAKTFLEEKAESKGMGERFIREAKAAMKRAGNLGMTGDAPKWTASKIASTFLALTLAGTAAHYTPDAAKSIYNKVVKETVQQVEKGSNTNLMLTNEGSGEPTDADIFEAYQFWVEYTDFMTNQLTNPNLDQDPTALAIRKLFLEDYLNQAI